MRQIRRWWIRPGLLAAGLTALPRLASACSVCFGAPDDPMTRGMNHAILVLLGFVGLVQAGFVVLFVRFWVRSRRLKRHRDRFGVLQGGAH